MSENEVNVNNMARRPSSIVLQSIKDDRIRVENLASCRRITSEELVSLLKLLEISSTNAFGWGTHLGNKI